MVKGLFMITKSLLEQISHHTYVPFHFPSSGVVIFASYTTLSSKYFLPNGHSLDFLQLHWLEFCLVVCFINS